MNNDSQEPRYHFTVPQVECFDPNGALWWKGAYHLFYIFQDYSLPEGKRDCWGHASSRDLVCWRLHPTALRPEPGDPENAIYSGCALVTKEGVPAIVYHGRGTGTCVAFAEDDDLIRWRKHPGNPVIREPTAAGQPGWGVYNVFDPHVWLDGETYYAILGGRVKPHECRDTAYLFRSEDLITWEYLRPFYNPNPRWTDENEDCACPDFFELDGRRVLMCISHRRGLRYYLGRLQDGTFVPEEHHRLAWPGGSCFASESLLDGCGRRIVWAWVLDQCAGAQGVPHGVMTLPRVLSMDGRGRLLLQPASELERLRHNQRRLTGLTVSPDQEIRLEGFDGDVMELRFSADIPEGGMFGLKVRVAPDGSEQTAIIVDTNVGTLSVDSSRAGPSQAVCRRFPITALFGDAAFEDVALQAAPFSMDAGEPLDLRVFLDKSIIEVYANGRQCVTQRIYPSRIDSTGVFMFASGGAVKVNEAEAWDMHG